MCMSPKTAKIRLAIMKESVESNGYKVRWNYKRNNNNVPIITNCKIYKIGDEFNYYGKSICHKNDTASKAIGKMISMSRALIALGTKDTFYFNDSLHYKYLTLKYVEFKQ